MSGMFRSVTRRRQRVSLALIVGMTAMVAAVPSPAGAATQIGETFAPPAPPCGGPGTWLQSGSPNGQYATPFPGVITSWSYQAGSAAGQLKLKVVRAVGVDTFFIVGESALETSVPNTVNTYGTQISVAAGDMLGLRLTQPLGCRRPAASTYLMNSTFEDAPPGDTLMTGPTSSGFQLDASAFLEPDCDGDGFGDETQDPSLFGGNCPARGRNVILDANKNKVKRGKKVVLSGRVGETARQGECQSAQTVELQRKRPKRTTFTTFAQVQTDAQGSFSLKQKVKKTFEYRAQVVGTATCTSALSNTEKVKVRKKR
jgi:hypothetical protein